jgi:hypothetical protein
MTRKWQVACVLSIALVRPAAAGPGTTARAGTSGEAGIDFNYGTAPDLQLTATLPSGFDRPSGGKTTIGLGNIELAANNLVNLHQYYD